MTTRKQTNADAAPDWGLSQQQQTAIDLIVSEKNLQETPTPSGCSGPRSVTGSITTAAFRRAVNARRQALWDGLVDEMRGLPPGAGGAQGGNGGRHALAGRHPCPEVLWPRGGPGAPTGPTTVEEAEQAQVQRDIERIRTAPTPEAVALAEQRRHPTGPLRR